MINKLNKHKVTFYLTEKQYDELKKLSQQTDMSQGYHIRIAVDRYLKTKK
jgi:predicted DNA-binding protein